MTGLPPTRLRSAPPPDPDEIGEALERIMELPAAEREAAIRREYGDRPEMCDELLRLSPHADAQGFLEAQVTRIRGGGLAHLDVVRPGRVFGRRWKTGRVIEYGGQGAVCEAEDTVLGGPAVAVKLLRGKDAAAVARIRREAAAMRWLRLPGVVRLLDDGVDGDVYWLAMERVDGRPFPGKRSAPLPWEELEPLALGLLEAVGRVHASGVVHADIKPGNVLVDDRGVVTLLDLGIAAASGDRFRSARYAVGGTLGFAAPECVAGGAPDFRSDLYAIGVLLAVALTGRRPDDVSPAACASLPAPEAVRRVVAEMVEPRSDDRPHSAAAVLERLRGRPPVRRRRPWTAHGLRSRFGGFDVFHHLREDAARELFRRTGGDPASVEHELASWLRAGLARAEGGLVHVERAALERLAAMPAGPGRRRRPGSARARAFVAALAAGDARAAAAAAESYARECLDAGRTTVALNALEEGLLGACAAGDEARAATAGRLVVLAALQLASAREIDRAAWLLERTERRDPETLSLIRICRAAAALQRGDPRTAKRLSAAETRRAPGAVARLAWMVRVRVAIAADLRTHRRTVAAALRWAAGRRDPQCRTSARAWRGRLLYREGRCREALHVFAANVRAARTPMDLLRALQDASDAAKDAGHPAVAARLAARYRRMAAARRLASIEAYGHFAERTSRFRAGRRVPPDPAACEAADALGASGATIAHRLIEAGVQWQQGRTEAARAIVAPLVSTAPVRSLGPIPVLAECLHAAAGGAVGAARAARLGRRAREVTAPALALQALGLLALARPAARKRLRSLAGLLDLPREAGERSRRREFLTLDRAARALSLSDSGFSGEKLAGSSSR